MKIKYMMSRKIYVRDDFKLPTFIGRILIIIIKEWFYFLTVIEIIHVDIFFLQAICSRKLFA